MKAFEFRSVLLATAGGDSTATVAANLAVHRVNLPDAASLSAEIKELVGSKAGIAVLDSGSASILLPPGSSAEVDVWIFGGGECLLSHANPALSRIGDYPTLEQFISSWQIKRELERRLGSSHGYILANVKTHGAEEWLLESFEKHGISQDEVVLLDQEYPATERLLKGYVSKGVAPLLVRVSRIEPLDNVMSILSQPRTFARPRGFFFDPIGSEQADYPWPFAQDRVRE